MTKEQKQLLLQDLCARLPYGVIVNFSYDLVGVYILTGADIDKFANDYIVIRPYLRPMSSMTEEEKEEYDKTFDWDYSIQGTPFDWLNAHHFDYRGLIEKGLAIEVTNDNDPYKPKT